MELLERLRHHRDTLAALAAYGNLADARAAAAREQLAAARGEVPAAIAHLLAVAADHEAGGRAEQAEQARAAAAALADFADDQPADPLPPALRRRPDRREG